MDNIRELIEEAYQERVRYQFIMSVINLNVKPELSMEVHAIQFAQHIEKLQEFKIKAIQALINRGLLPPIPTTVYPSHGL